MAVTKQQRRAAFIALAMAASAGGGYVSKDELIRIGQHYCGQPPSVIIQELNRFSAVVRETSDPADVRGVDEHGRTEIRLKFEPATGLLARWCDPDRIGVTEDVALKLRHEP